MFGASCRLICVVAACVVLAAAATAEDSVFRVMLEKCGSERQAYCSQVANRDMRIAACLYAHEDKASPACAVAIYDGMLAMQIAIGKIGGYVRSCKADVLKFCGSELPGEGRLYACLDKHKTAISGECQLVLNSTAEELEKLGLVQKLHAQPRN